MQLGEIKKLANLARINMSEEEMIGMAQDFDSILAYVDQIKEISNKVSGDLNEEDRKKYSYLRFNNIMRDDIPTDKPGDKVDKIIREMPEEKDLFLKVKQIL